MNMGVFILIAIAALWAIGIFMGAVGGLSKPFKQDPGIIDSSDIKSKQEQTIRDTEEKRKQMMDNLKQKMQDSNQRY